MASDLQGATLTIRGRAYRPIMANYLAALWAAQNPILQRGEMVSTLRRVITYATELQAVQYIRDLFLQVQQIQISLQEK